MKIQSLRKKVKAVFTVAQAKKVGVSRQLLAHYVKKAFIERVSYGVYRFVETKTIDFESTLKEIMTIIPYGVIGLKTALRIYDLTEELPDKIDIIVPKENVPKRALKDVKLYRVKKNLYKKYVINVRGLPVTSIERTIIDLLRCNEPLSSILEIIRAAQVRGISLSFSKIKKLALPFRVKNKVELLLEAWF